MTTPTAHTCVRCRRPYTPELQDFHLCCICERDLIATRTLGPNWTEKLIPLLDLMSPNAIQGRGCAGNAIGRSGC